MLLNLYKMLDALITSKTRIKLLIKFFLNSQASAYLRSLESEFGESSNAIRLELNKFEQAGLLCSRSSGNRKIYQANTTHPLFNDIHNILLKHVGLDRVIEHVIEKLGDIDKVYVTGEFARGNDCHIIDLLFVGNNINREYLVRLTEKAEKLINRKIRYVVFSDQDFDGYRRDIEEAEILLLWKDGIEQ